MALGTTAAFNSEASRLAAPEHGPRSGVYGGLVGNMIDDIDARMSLVAYHPAPAASREDFLHGISVVCGYVGLLAGFGAVAATLLRLF